MTADYRRISTHHSGEPVRACTDLVRVIGAQSCVGATLDENARLSYGARMLDPKFIDDLARRLSNTVPAGLREAQQDLEKNFRTVLQNTLAKLDLVTREEFDVQARLLSRTREKLEALEKTIAELEARQPKD
jgi:hypothetical protein